MSDSQEVPEYEQPIELTNSEPEMPEDQIASFNDLDKEGITILIDILNTGEFDILFDFNNPTEATCKAFALFLTLSESGNLYTAFKNKIQEILKEKNPEKTAIMKKVFEFKRIMDTNIDQPAILPRDVFRRGG